MKNFGTTIFTLSLFLFCILVVLFYRDLVCKKYGMEYSILAGQCVTGGTK